MSVLVTTVIPQLDAATYDRIAEQAAPVLTTAQGFQHHTAYAAPEGWTVVEVWSDENSFWAYFDTYIRPSLPPGTRPQVNDVHHTMAPVA